MFPLHNQNLYISYAGFAVDSVLKSGWTGLMYAVSNADVAIASLLLDLGANPNAHKGIL